MKQLLCLLFLVLSVEAFAEISVYESTKTTDGTIHSLKIDMLNDWKLKPEEACGRSDLATVRSMTADAEFNQYTAGVLGGYDPERFSMRRSKVEDVRSVLMPEALAGSRYNKSAIVSDGRIVYLYLYNGNSYRTFAQRPQALVPVQLRNMTFKNTESTILEMNLVEAIDTIRQPLFSRWVHYSRELKIQMSFAPGFNADAVEPCN